ncbi:MAG: GIY-YIG nuclease family protein [Deltaproteobacteria bacterium]|nr:GIY-YIG nuclease family protein [Deltaproteobacteria bacterium]
MKGWVYVISNKAMPGLVKVGYSMKDPALRAQELDHTGSPHPYIVDYELLVEEPFSIEQKVHSHLKNHREGKEWFRCTSEQAVVAIKQVAGDKQILENFKLADRQKAEELQRKEEELQKAKDLQEEQNRKAQALFKEKEQEIINKYDKSIKDAANTFGVTGLAFLCALLISTFSLGVIGNLFNIKVFDSDIISLIIIAIATFVIGNKIKPFFIKNGFNYHKEDISTAYNNRGVEFHNNGLHDRAIEDYNKAIELDQNGAQIYNSRGLAYYNKGNMDKAISDFQKACDMGNKDGCKNVQQLKNR